MPGVVATSPDADSWGRGLLRSPLVPVAALFTLGIVVDRVASPGLGVTLAAFAGSLAAWAFALLTGPRRLALVYAGLCVVAVGVARNQVAVGMVPAQDVGRIAQDGPVPLQVRGRVLEVPRYFAEDRDVLRSMPREAYTRFDLAVAKVRQGGHWQPASGQLRVYLTGPGLGIRCGDDFEATGVFEDWPGPSNPGEADRAAWEAEQGTRGRFFVSRVPEAWLVSDPGGLPTVETILANLRGFGSATLDGYLPPATAPLGRMLLLGDGTGLDGRAWDGYLRTGVVAVLAISGQHLVILGVFLAGVGRLLGVRLRWRVAAIAAILFGYALLTGGRPAALRAALLVLGYALAEMLRLRVPAGNLLAGAWVILGLIDPADLFSPGCQFSFLAVAVLVAFPVNDPIEPTDPLRRALEQADPPAWQAARSLGRLVVRLYVGTLVLWLALTPQAVWYYNLVSPVGVLLGPPLTGLAAVALVLGFVLLLVGPILPPVGYVLAAPLDGVLRAMQGLIETGEALPGAWAYVPDLGFWWVLAFYGGLAVGVALPWPAARWRVLFLFGPVWLTLVLLMPHRGGEPGELRATFLAVGHGGCVVLEMPDGRVVLYDAGSLRGPGVVASQIAPFLWSRGIGRIDEVLLSHGDLDHFNALPGLLDRFAVGQVSATPTFADRGSPAIDGVLARLASARVAYRTLRAGQVLRSGTTAIEVLHPPPTGPSGPENVRSLVLRVVEGERSLLLTGDVEEAGLAMLLAGKPRRAEVVQFPHHGSRRLDPTGLVAWTGADWLIASQGTGWAKSPPALEGSEVRCLSTATAGAVTCRATVQGWVVETFR